MSLINDALKRAKQAQDQAPPPVSPGPHLRPIEPVPYVRHGVEFLVPTTLAVAALLVLFLAWRWAYQGKSEENGVRAKSVAAQERSPSAQTTPATESPKPLTARVPEIASAAVTPPTVSSDVQPAVAQTPGVQSPSQPKSATETTQQSQPSSPQTNVTQAVAVAAQDLSKPPPLKLQGIVFSPTRPSAVINGRPLFVGDRIRDFKVVAINRESVTLAGSGQTNVLSLSE